MGALRNLEVPGVVSLVVALSYGSQPLLFSPQAAPETSSMTIILSFAHPLPLLLMNNAVWLLIQKPGVYRVHAYMSTCVCLHIV